MSNIVLFSYSIQNLLLFRITYHCLHTETIGNVIVREEEDVVVAAVEAVVAVEEDVEEEVAVEEEGDKNVCPCRFDIYEHHRSINIHLYHF